MRTLDELIEKLQQMRNMMGGDTEVSIQATQRDICIYSIVEVTHEFGDVVLRWDPEEVAD